MNNFKILPSISWYTCPIVGNRKQGRFISKIITAYYHSEYHAGSTDYRKTIGTVENIITTLKNQFQKTGDDILIQAGRTLVEILKKDLSIILRKQEVENLIVCVIPRAKTQSKYTNSQLVFKNAVKISIKTLEGFVDGTDYIIRHTDTRTTHLDKSGYGGDGDLPYPGITKKTCNISENIVGKDVILIDDLYTDGVNIDEDAIEALFDKGAKSVIFYAVGKTVRNQ